LILSRYVNFFQPSMKLVSKTRHGARVHKVYDQAQTPYQRLLASGVLSEAKQRKLAAVYHGLNPMLLLRQLNESLESLWKLTHNGTPWREKTNHQASVTPDPDATPSLQVARCR